MKPYLLKISIRDLPKRINQAPGASWTARYGESQKWLKLVTQAMRISGINPPVAPLTKASLMLVRHSSQCPDYDGLVQSFKPVVDALRRCLVIADDSMKVIGIPEYRWLKAKPGAGYIEIQVREGDSMTPEARAYEPKIVLNRREIVRK